MPLLSFNKFHSFSEALAEKVHNLSSDTLKVMLTNTAPVATNTVKANLTEIAAGNGYTAGGHTITVSSSSQTSGTYKLVLSDVTITATGGSIGPFRYAVVYNDTATNDELIGWYDYNSSSTLQDGEALAIDFNATNGIIQLA
jgi:flagellar capping protein FliD